MPRDYDDFDLLFQATGEKYLVQLLNSPAGQAESEFISPFSQTELSNFYNRIGQLSRKTRRLESPDRAAAKAFGAELFGATFKQEILARLRTSIERSRQSGRGLRVRLRLRGTPELGDLPWEFLYDREQDHFLATSSLTPVIRYLDLPQSVMALRVRLPLRILVAIASPRNLPRLDSEGEWNRLLGSLESLQRSGLVILERLEGSTLQALRRRARGEPFHIFHFIGHGSFDQVSNDGALQFEDQMGMSDPITGQLLGNILRDHDSIRLGVLNACEGARQATDDPFSGTAQSLCQQGLPAVIAMQFEISDDAAKTFAEEFYSAIADSLPIDAAMGEARKALFTSRFGQEWATPVLYMRSPSGQLFDVRREGRNLHRHREDRELESRQASGQVESQSDSGEATQKVAADTTHRAEDERKAEEERKRVDAERLAAQTRLKEESEQIAAQTRQREEAERITAQARQKEEAARTAAQARRSNSKLVVGVAAFGLVIVLVVIANTRPTPGTAPAATATNVTAPPATTDISPPATTVSAPPATTDQTPSDAAIDNWIEQFFIASQGPSTQALQAYFADNVSPYFNMQSASWAQIERDKEAYFKRFPQIRYSIAGRPRHSTLDNGNRVVEFIVDYSAVRNDGKTSAGRYLDRFTLSQIGGSLKIVGAEEGKP